LCQLRTIKDGYAVAAAKKTCDGVGAVTMTEAKTGLAITFGVPPEAIEIAIRGWQSIHAVTVPNTVSNTREHYIAAASVAVLIEETPGKDRIARSVRCVLLFLTVVNPSNFGFWYKNISDLLRSLDINTVHSHGIWTHREGPLGPRNPEIKISIDRPWN
jgi:hypothetical protein